MTDELTREHERALLACALLGGAQTARTLLDMVQAPMLADAKLARTWSALRRVLVGATGPVDLTDALAAELSGDADSPGLIDLHQLATSVPSAANASYYAQRVIDHYVRRHAGRDCRGYRSRTQLRVATADLLLGIEARARRMRELADASASTSGPLLIESPGRSRLCRLRPSRQRPRHACEDDSSPST